MLNAFPSRITSAVFRFSVAGSAAEVSFGRAAAAAPPLRMADALVALRNDAAASCCRARMGLTVRFAEEGGGGAAAAAPAEGRLLVDVGGGGSVALGTARTAAPVTGFGESPLAGGAAATGLRGRRSGVGCRDRTT